MNKALKVILNILIVAASLVFLYWFANMCFSIQYANREVEDPVATYAGVFEYELEHRAYGEVMEDYYVRRLKSFTAPEGYEDLYRVAEYAHTAFMTRVFDEKGDSGKASLYSEKLRSLRKDLGAYGYTAGEIDEMIEKAP